MWASGRCNSAKISSCQFVLTLFSYCAIADYLPLKAKHEEEAKETLKVTKAPIAAAAESALKGKAKTCFE